MRKIVVSLIAALAIFPNDVFSQNGSNSEGRLVAANYVISFSQIFLGKTIRGQNLGRSFVRSLYEAVPATAMQYAGMKMVGRNWRLALPAQLLVQKGAALERRSILGEPVLSRELLTSWDLDYLWFNLRIRNGRVLAPRLNVVTTVATVTNLNARLDLGYSLTTGVVFFSHSREVPDDAGGIYIFGTIHTASVGEGYNELVSHELIHRFQDIREGVLPEVFLKQDRERGWPVSLLRLDFSLSYPNYWLQKRLNPHCYGCRFYEWEAGAYSGNRW